jgi:ketosteroid isomerase-like protein
VGVAPNDNRSALLALGAAFNDQDRDTMEDLLTEDIEWNPALGSFLSQSVYRGRREVCDLVLHEIPSEIERFRADIVEIHDAGPDRLIAEVRFTGIGRVSRVPVDQVFFHLYRLRGGRLASMHPFPSYEAAAEAARAHD